MAERFHGFPSDLPDFLFALKLKNTLADLPQNKVKYKTMVTEPLTDLYCDMVPVIESISERLDTKLSRCISSMYTDRRFSPQTPLKEYMYLRFMVSGKTDDAPGFYFDMGPDYYSYGLRIYHQTAQGIAEVREKILKNIDIFDDELNKAKSVGFVIMGAQYKRDHCPILKDSPAKELLSHRDFYIGKDKPVSPIIHTKTLANELKTGYLELKGIFTLLKDKSK